MVKPAKFLTPDERERIRASIAEAERATAGEIRVLVVGRSTPRPIFLPLIFGAFVGFSSYLRFEKWSWHNPGLLEINMALAIGVCVALVLFLGIPSTRKQKKEAVWKRAQREFVKLGIGKTAGSTGVLVMLSLYERQAVVLADKAINDKVTPDTWDRDVKILLDGVRAGKPADGITSAVSEVGALLAKHFPRKDDDRNELPDDVVVR